MKKLIFSCLLISLLDINAFAQNYSEKLNANFFGVDFSVVNVIGAVESQQQFIDAFVKINELLIIEESKYNVGKYLYLNILSIDYEPALSQIDKLKEIKFKNNKVEINLQDIVSKYPFCENNGLVIIAIELNRRKKIGTYIAVLYDGTSKKILSKQEFSGSCGGNGLRNYWAKTLYRGLNNLKYKRVMYNSMFY